MSQNFEGEFALTAENAFRSAYWDNIKGFLIILVIFGHCRCNLQDSPINNVLVDAIYMFHMPAFVFVSGYFSKSEHSRSFFPIMNLFVAFILLNGFFLIREIFAPRGGGYYQSSIRIIRRGIFLL